METNPINLNNLDLNSKEGLKLRKEEFKELTMI